jgi:hypothetical protein
MLGNPKLEALRLRIEPDLVRVALRNIDCGKAVFCSRADADEWAILFLDVVLWRMSS